MVFRDTAVAPATGSRQDGTRPVTGTAGEVAEQDKKKLVVRSGATANQSDYDIIKNADGDNWDLIGDGDFTIPGDTPTDRTERPDIGGTVKAAGAIISADNNSFNITFDWYDENDNVLVSQTFSSSTGGINSNHNVTIEQLYTKSDFVGITITDTSGGGSNNIHGSINFHA